MSELSQTKYCGCRMLGTRWMYACPAHRAQYIELSARVLKYYEQFRRQAEMPVSKQENVHG